MIVPAASAAALAAGLLTPAAQPLQFAEAPAAAEANQDPRSVVIVTGARDGYSAGETRAATRTDTPLQDVPQAVTIVTEEQIEDLDLRSIGDVLRYVPGATIAQGEGHRDQIVLRGNNSTSDFFIDGLRDDIQYYRPLYNLERVEVLRGPNAMIFGRGGGGGIVNRVTKQPLFTSLIAGSASIDTFGAWSIDADVNLPVTANIALRANAVHERFDNHRSEFDGELTAINPAVRLDAGPNTSFILSYEYVDDDRVVDRGIPSEGGAPLVGFRNTFFGTAANQLGFAGHLLRGSAEHRFTPDLRLTSRLLFADYDKIYTNAFPATAVASGPASRQLGIEAYQDAFQRENLFSQTDLVWTVRTGPATHTLLAGVEVGRQETGNQRLNGFFDSGVATTNNRLRTSVPLGDPIAIPPITFRAGSGQRGTATDVDLLAFYVQDQVEFGPVELIAGLRYDRFALDAVNLLNGQSFSRTDDLWSPRLGVVVHPVAPVSLYASYSRSYLPQSGDQFASLDLTAAALEPERFENYEIGAKWQLRPGLLVSAALYQLDRTNTRAPGAAAGEVVLTGAQRSRGFELEAAGEVMPGWQVSLAFTLQEAEITTTTAAAPAGRVVPLVPETQIGVWSRYDFAPGLGAGIGVIHQGDSFASISNAVTLPAFTRVDLGLFWRISDRVEAQVNVQNLFDEGYFPTAHNDNNISTGAPLNARLTVRLSL